jgi:hypothetical protein
LKGWVLRWPGRWGEGIIPKRVESADQKKWRVKDQIPIKRETKDVWLNEELVQFKR